MQVVFRTDASRVIGSGHVMRCLTLAESLRQGGVGATFICRPHAGNLNDLLRARGFEVAELSTPRTGSAAPGEPAHAAWVGADWRDDARETCAVIGRRGRRPDWLAVDHYGLDERWEAELRREAAGIFAIDDLADRRHDCDLLLDQNLVEGIATRYTGKLPERCSTMLGPRYALLQPVYAELQRQLTPRTGAVRRVCISFGAADVHGVTRLALRALLDLNIRDLQIDVLADGAEGAALHADAAGRAGVRLHERLPTLAHLLAEADLAIGAAGATSWERLCLGVPSVVITLADNQRPVAAALAKRGLIDWLGHYDEVGPAALQDALARRIAAGADTECSRAGRALVDGAGARRVRAALVVSAGTPLAVRPAVDADEELLLEWANDPVTRRNSFDRGVIGADEHHRWLRDKMSAGGNCLLLLVETQDGVPLATARFERIEGGWWINYTVAPPYRARGLGTRVLELALATLTRAHPEASCVRARVMATNEPSRRIFKRLGFEIVSDAAGAVQYRRTL